MRAHTLIVPDTHGPHHDAGRVRELARWRRAMRPRLTLHIGDAGDCYGPSRFGKRLDADPGSWPAERAAIRWLMRLLGVDIWLEGNHEVRPSKRAEERPFEAPYHRDPYAELAAELGIRYVPGGIHLRRDLLICHGEHGGMPAKAEAKARRTGLSVCQGHTHKLSLQWLGPKWYAMEVGHLVDPTAKVFRYSGGADAGLNGWTSGFGWIDTKGVPHVERL